MVCNPFNRLLNAVCQYFVKDFYINFQKGYCSVAFSYSFFFSDFRIRVMLVLFYKLGSQEVFPPLQLFGKRLRTDITSLNIQLKLPVKPIGPGFSIVGNFLIIDSISLLVIGLFRFFISCDLVLVDFVFLGICSLHLGYPICWFAVIHSSLL